MITATSWQECGLLCCSEWLALNVYVALCYCNMDFYDVSLEILDIYLQVGHHDQSCWILREPYRETLSSVNLTTLSSALTSTLKCMSLCCTRCIQKAHWQSMWRCNLLSQAFAVLMCLYVHLVCFLEMSWDLDICTDQLYVGVQACNNYKLYNGKAAEADFKALKPPIENALVKHNLVVFKDGDSALQVCFPVSLWHSWLYHYCRPKLQSSI